MAACLLFISHSSRVSDLAGPGCPARLCRDAQVAEPGNAGEHLAKASSS